MTSDAIEIKTLDNVVVQANGIIRDDAGKIIARLVEGTSFDSLPVTTIERTDQYSDRIQQQSLVLKQDLVIKAGTIFSTAPVRTSRVGAGHYQAIIGLSNNTAGFVEYYVDEDPEVMDKWFDTIDDSG